jgi:outer membrane protein OmpA-like peptidoglycan-associated protein
MDGIIDALDKCPFLKGSEAMQGCPDSDKDGISDRVDYCPFLYGDKNNSGCPKMNKEEHQTFLQKESITARIEFDTDQAVIKSRYYRTLDEVVIFLQLNKDAQAFISGHTDDEGNGIYNFQLGERRAYAVKEYFLKAGVSFSQLTIISFGETKPLQANGGNLAKAKNRRVEVLVVKK